MEVIGPISDTPNSDTKEASPEPLPTESAPVQNEVTPEPKEAEKVATPEPEVKEETLETLSNLAEEILDSLTGDENNKPSKEKSPSVEAISPEPEEPKTNGNHNFEESKEAEDQNTSVKGLPTVEKVIPEPEIETNGLSKDKNNEDDGVEIIGSVEEEV